MSDTFQEAEAGPKRPAAPLTGRTQLAITVLLLLACLHCTRAIFFDNVSWINLRQYAAGTERKPFQERVAMMPVLRIAGSNQWMKTAAAALDREDRHQLGRRELDCAEPFTPEKLASLLVGILCNVVAAAALFYATRTLGNLQWLAPALFLVILYISYAARYEEAYWYPYDLPHMLLFGLACLCLFRDRLWLFLLFFALDIPMRETSIYLVLLAAPFLWSRWKGRSAAIVVCLMAAAWVASRLAVARAFAPNASETGSRIILNLKNLALPLHWPQMASLLGFLLVPVWMGRRWLPPAYRLFLYMMLPCLAVTAWFGIWIESRIALEWTIPLAYLATIEIANAASPCLKLKADAAGA